MFEWMNTSPMGFHIKSIYFKRKLFSPVRHGCLSWCFIHFPWLHVHSLLPIFKKQECSITGAIICCTVSNFILCGSHTSSSYNLDGISFIICAFLMSRSSFQSGPQLSPNFCILRSDIILSGNQYVKAENNFILCDHCPFKHILWAISFPAPAFISYS